MHFAGWTTEKSGFYHLSEAQRKMRTENQLSLEPTTQECLVLIWLIKNAMVELLGVNG
jgi:hypothetical protein